MINLLAKKIENIKKINLNLQRLTLISWLVLAGIFSATAISSLSAAEDDLLFTENEDAGGDKVGKEAQPINKDISEMNLEELQTFQKFVYVSGRKDPFTFREVKKEEVKESIDDGVDIGVPVAGNLPNEKQQERELKQWYASARARLISGAYDKSVEICESAISKIEKWGGVVSAASQRMYERVLSLRETARRLSSRVAVKREFESLPIAVSGIRISQKGSAALINDAVVEAGMSVSVGQDIELQIDSIVSDGVIFIFKGQRIKKKIGSEIFDN